MFIKITKSGQHEYAQLVKSYRENGVVKHKVVLNFGRLDQIENNPSIQRLAIRLQELSKVKNRVDLDSFSEAQIVNWGYVVYQKIWKEFGLDRILTELKESGKTQFDLNNACFLMAVQHLLEPRSKLGTYHHQDRYVQLPPVDLNHLYRSLDLLCEHKETLEEYLFLQNRHLFNLKVDVVFYDVTTFYFESVKVDTLKDFGYSKDGKFSEVQVVLGLLMDCEGRPIGYELFPGSTFEGKTLEASLEKLEQRFGIRRVIIVADRGLNAKPNLLKIAAKGYGYIVASRIKKMPQRIQEEILNPDGYTELDPEEKIRYKVIDYLNRVEENGKIYELPEKLIVTYSPARAKKDRADRERLIEKAKSLLENKSRIKASVKRGGKKYLKGTGELDWVLDQEAIAKDERFDGYYGIQTSEKELKVQDVLDAYHTLWKIEESFRIMKSTLEVRPVFHWTEPRIKGHFVVCFLSFLLERTLEFHLKRAKVAASPERIREALNSLAFVEMEIEQKKFYVKAKGTELSNKILRALRIKPPKNVTPAEELVL
jgi:transposase, IS4 family